MSSIWTRRDDEYPAELRKLRAALRFQRRDLLARAYRVRRMTTDDGMDTQALRRAFLADAWKARRDYRATKIGV